MLREQAFVPRGWQKSTSPEISIAVISGVESACFSNAWLTEHSLFWSCFVHRLPRPFLAVYVIIHCQKAGKGRMAVYVAFWRCMLFSAIGYRPFWRCMSTFLRWIRFFSGEFPRAKNSLPPGGVGRTLGMVSRGALPTRYRRVTVPSHKNHGFVKCVTDALPARYRPVPRFVGRYRHTPYVVYKSEKREGWVPRGPRAPKAVPNIACV